MKIFDVFKRAIEFFAGKATIRKDGNKSKPYCVYSKNGKNMGCYPSRKSAEKRLREIEIFKHLNK